VIFYKLQPTKHVFATTVSGLISGGNPSLVNEFGTAITFTSGKPPTIFSGFGTTIPSSKYFMYTVNDTTTSRKGNVARFQITYEDISLNQWQTFILLPLNTPIRVYVSRSTLINEFITKQGLSAATAAACPFDTYTNLYISALVPNAATLVDGLVEFDYQKS